jgi:hypothetical protein
VDESRTDEFHNFSNAAYFFDRYNLFAAWSILFVAVRSIKFMVAMPQLRLVVLTLSTAFWELLAVLLILFLALFGFACMFFVRYGTRFTRYGDIVSSFCELFIFMCGVFETDDLLHSAPLFFVFTFPLVQIIFYFFLANMFLATIVYKWTDVRRDAQEDVGATLWNGFKDRCFKESLVKNDDGDNEMALDINFWQESAVLNYLSLFDETGAIRGLDRKAATPGSKQDGATPEDGETSLQPLQKDGEKDGKMDKIFKKAHMEIASIMCRRVKDKDTGYGVGMENNNESQQEEGEEKLMIGILTEDKTDRVDKGTAEKIKQDLREKLKPDERHGHADVAQEIWLDALVSVLEDCGALKKVQEFFLPPPMIRPKSSQEWGKFDEKKTKMEKRLNLFLRLLREATRTAHYKYLKDSAKTKEKVMKQQSLVLADYLENLDKRIQELQQDIKYLERKNNEMRSHVSPLL